MSDQQTEHEEHTEEIHLPGPSFAPIILALGMTLTLVGVVNTGFFFIGGLVLLVGVGMWAFTDYH